MQAKAPPGVSSVASPPSDTLLLMKLWNYIPTMGQPKHLQALSAATLRLLRPLVKILLRNNVSARSKTNCNTFREAKVLGWEKQKSSTSS